MVKFVTTSNQEVWINPRLVWKAEKTGDTYRLIDEHSSSYILTEPDFIALLERMEKCGFAVA